MFLAQMTQDSIPSWMSVVIQGGAFGLVVYIVVYLYPTLNRQAMEERKGRDDRFFDLVNALQIRFEDRNKLLADAIGRQTKEIVQEFHESAGRIEAVVAAACKHPA